MIRVRLRDQDQQPLCVVTLDDGEVRVEETEDRVLMVKLHAHFAGEQNRKVRDETGALSIEELPVGSEAHFATALRQLERAGYVLELCEGSSWQED